MMNTKLTFCPFHFQESRKANRTLESGSSQTDGECRGGQPMSPILRRVIDANHQHHRKCNGASLGRTHGASSRTHGGGHHNASYGNLSKNYSHSSNVLGQKSYVDLPQATLDLSAGSGLVNAGNGKLGNTSVSSHIHNSTAIKSALELSTLV